MKKICNNNLLFTQYLHTQYYTDVFLIGLSSIAMLIDTRKKLRTCVALGGILCRWNGLTQ